MNHSAHASSVLERDPQRRDPLAGVANLGVAGAAGASLAISAGLHAFAVQSWVVAWFLTGFLTWQVDLQARVKERMQGEIVLDIEPEAKPPEPEKEELPKEEPPKAELPKETPKADVEQRVAPAAAQAGQIIAAAPDPNAPVDFGNTFVQGPGDGYTGGVTDSKGTEKTKVTAVAAKGTGGPGPAGTAAVAVAALPKDCARATRLRGGSAWDCSFPPEADTEQIDQASATIEVTVNSSGRVDSVRVLQDPGHGFGRSARACAMSKAFDAAIGNECTAITSTKSFRVNFNR
jgi:periplasmic protein TonB